MAGASGRGGALRAAVLGLAAGAVLPGSLPAADWSLTGRLSQRLQADSNSGLDPAVSDAILTATLGAGLVLTAETKRALVSADLGVSASYFLGEDPDLAGTGRIDPRVALRGSYRGKTYTLDGQASLDVNPTTFTQAGETGTSETGTTQVTVSYSAGLSLQLDQLNTLAFGTTGSLIDFSRASDDLVANRTFGLTATWTRRLTGVSTLDLTAGLRQFAADNPEETRSQTLDISAGLTHRRTPRHTFGVSAGLSGIRTEERGAGVDFDIGLTGAASLDYRLAALSAGFDLSQSVEPSSEGALQSFTRLGARFGYAINDRESFDLAARFSRRTPLSGGGADASSTLDFFSIGPSYSIALTEQARLTFGYTFQASRDSDEGTATGHQILLSAERRFDLVP